MKAMVLGLGLAVVLPAVVGLSFVLSPSGMQAQAQASPAAAGQRPVGEWLHVGQAAVRWDAVADAAYYRIGWMRSLFAMSSTGGKLPRRFPIWNRAWSTLLSQPALSVALAT